jgi:ubiquinone biosynthesis protein COQ9
MITAHVNGDKDALEKMTVMTQDELAPVAGALLAYCGNLIQIISICWESSDAPAAVWEAILAAERDVI